MNMPLPIHITTIGEKYVVEFPIHTDKLSYILNFEEDKKNTSFEQLIDFIQDFSKENEIELSNYSLYINLPE